MEAKLREFEREHKKNLVEAMKLHSEFLQRYPFREHPERIEQLTPEEVYNPGAQDYFLGWIEFKLKRLGRIAVGSALYAEAARESPEKFKELLRVAADPSFSVAEKIDASWELIRGFGGDKLVAWKIIFCYYPEKILPIFKTEHLEHYVRQLGVDYVRDAYNPYGKSYDTLSTGQKCEFLNSILFKTFAYQNKELGVYETLLLARFLYETFPPQKLPIPTKRERIEPLHPLGALFEPECEQEVVYLFSVLHRDLGFPSRLLGDIRALCKGPGATANGIKRRAAVNARRFDAMEIPNPRSNYFFTFYSERVDTNWIVPSEDLV